MQKKEGMKKKAVDAFQALSLMLSIRGWIYLIIGLVCGELTMVPFLEAHLALFGLFCFLLALILVAIIAIFVRRREEKKEAVNLEKKIQLQNGLKLRQVRHRGEPQIRIYQRFGNASDLDVEITKIEAILKGASNKTIDQFFYNASDSIHKDEDKLIFPKKIPSPSLDEVIEYRISGEEKLKHLKHTGSLKQVITFSNGATTIIKHPADKPVYGEGIGSR